MWCCWRIDRLDQRRTFPRDRRAYIGVASAPQAPERLNPKRPALLEPAKRGRYADGRSAAVGLAAREDAEDFDPFAMVIKADAVVADAKAEFGRVDSR